jgi:opacity protein-like surface antigen
MKTRALLALVVVVLVVGCSIVDSDQVSPDTVYMSWWGQYSEDQARMEWSATYMVGGGYCTYLELTGRSNSTVNGESMAPHHGILNTIDYEWSRVFAQASSPQQTYVLQYTDTAGKAYSNTVSLPPRPWVDSAQNTNVSLSSKNYDVKWDTASSVGGSDTLQATISMTGVTVTAYEDDPAGASGKLRFKKEQLSQLKPGSARLRICVTRSSGLSQVPPRGGNLSLSYCSVSTGLKIDF